MKKLMVIGNAFDERIFEIVRTAKELEIRTVIIGGIYHEESEKMADSYYVADFDDTDTLIEIAKKEEIDGVISAFDKAMFSVMKIAEALKLPGIPPESIEKLLSKGQFRMLQKNAAVFCPAFVYADELSQLLREARKLKFPIIVKPDRSSASRGQTVLEEYDESAIEKAYYFAKETSVNGRVVAEEFISHHGLNILEGDVFAVGETILWDGLRYCFRTPEEPLIPTGDIMPIYLPDEKLSAVKKTISTLLANAGCTLGEYNFESYFTDNGEFFVVEINPRQAGMHNPQEIYACTGVDLTKLLVTTAVGDQSYFEELKDFRRKDTPVLSYTLFCNVSGVFKDIQISEQFRKHLLNLYLLKQYGDEVNTKHSAVDAVANLHFVFDSLEERDLYMTKVRENVCAIVVPK